MAGRPWSNTEDWYLRRAVGTVPYTVIAKRIDRSVTACRQHAFLLELYVRHPNARYGPEFEAFLRRKNAEGWPDCDIADAWPRGERNAVSRHRKRLKLRDNARHPRQRAQWAKMARDQCEEAGVKSLGELRVLIWQNRAVAQGWPADCTPLMCQVLGVLEYRPRTRREICLALNRPYHTQHALRNGRGQTLTAVLMHKGYVIRYGRRPFAPGRGKTEYVYGLAPGFRRRKVSGVG